MARTKKNVDKAKLEAAIEQSETNQTFTRLGDLWTAATTIYNESVDDSEQITESVVMLRVKEFGIQIQTEPGRRGRVVMSDEHKAAMQAARGNRVARSTRFKDNPHYQAAIAAVDTQLTANGCKTRMAGTFNGFAKGSVKAAIRLNCFNCMGESIADVKGCTSMTCAFWPHRPWQYDWQKDGTEPSNKKAEVVS